MMEQSIEQGSCHDGAAEDISPLGKAAVRGPAAASSCSCSCQLLADGSIDVERAARHLLSGKSMRQCQIIIAALVAPVPIKERTLPPPFQQGMTRDQAISFKDPDFISEAVDFDNTAPGGIGEPRPLGDGHPSNKEICGSNRKIY